MDILLYGTGESVYSVDGKEMIFPGVLIQLEQKYKDTDSDYVRRELEAHMRTHMCPVCEGKRLRPELLSVTVAGRSIADLVQLPIDDLSDFFEALEKGTIKQEEGLRSVLERVTKEVMKRLENLCQVGLGYLTLDRASMSLSGGEAQRLRFSTQLC